MNGLYKIAADELMRLCRQAQQQGCFATSEAILKELGRRGPAIRQELAA